MENSLVYKSNRLIEAKYNLSLSEQKVILYAVSKLDRDRDKFNVLSLEIKEFSELIGSTADRYSEVREVVRGLRKKEVIIDTGERELITGWLSSIDYIKNSGTVEIEFSEKLIPYLLKLKEAYTKYQIKNVMHLKSKHSIRIYEMLKQYQGFKKPEKDREFKIQELRDYLGIRKDEYKRFYDFEKRVLKASVKEINTYTDIKARYEKIKYGKKITAIKFTATYPASSDYDKLAETYDMKDIRSKCGLNSEKWTDGQVLELYSIAAQKSEEIDTYAYIKLNYYKMINEGKARNKFAYLKKAIEEDYAKAYNQIRYGYVIGAEGEDVLI